MISCVSFGIIDDTQSPSTGDHSPLSGSRPGGSDRSGGGSMDHGLDGDRWQDRVPREPMWFINPGPGETNQQVHPEFNARGYAVWWRRDDAVAELIRRIHNGYDVGARWFFINRPMGSTQAVTNLPGASWLTLEDEKRTQLPMQLTDALLDEFNEPVHIVWYVGSDMSDPRSYPGWTPQTSDQFYKLGQHDTWAHLIGTRTTLGGWISTGASGLGLDSVSPPDERELFIELFEQLNNSPFRFNLYGEALPLIFDQHGPLRDQYGARILDQDAIVRMPWMATSAFMDERWPLGTASEAFPLNTDTTRVFVWLEKSTMRYGNEDQRIDLINQYVDRGLIPITYDPVMFRQALNRLNPSRSSANEPDPGSGARQSRSSHPSRSGRSAKSQSAQGRSTHIKITPANPSSKASRTNLPRRYRRGTKTGP